MFLWATIKAISRTMKIKQNSNKTSIMKKNLYKVVGAFWFNIQYYSMRLKDPEFYLGLRHIRNLCYIQKKPPQLLVI